jgi:hypothetical protein
VSELHDHTHDVRAKRVRDAAYADSTTRCWRCGRTLAEVRAAFPRRRVTWMAGHLERTRWSPLKAECSPCNLGDGQRITMEIRRSSGGTKRF